MDVDFFPTCTSDDEEEDVYFDDAHEGAERCGICMDAVVDRGALDSCEHWFCFLCIDNWATITNLCPLCQNEFQSITCVPVYDTVGSSMDTGELVSRDDQWSIEEKNNTLSFPSYYIDENAVVCLDGDGCILRSGSVSTSEDPDMDTSIACDSCDIWYHAYCVGFDTNNSSKNSWFCPRCTGDEPQKSNETPKINSSCDQPYGTTDGYCVDSGVSNKVSVSIADTGETAIVVSMITKEQCGESKENKSEVSVLPGCDVGSLGGGSSISCIHENSELIGVGHSMPLLSSQRGDILERDGDEEIPLVSALKRKVGDCSTENNSSTYGKEINNEVETISGNSKRARIDETVEMIPPLKTKTSSILDLSTKDLSSKAGFDDQKIKQSIQKYEKIDNLSLIHDPISRHLKNDALSNLAQENTSEVGMESGRRIKKIMRRSTDGKDSAVILQKLREEIKEAVQNKSAKDVGELFNPKLLEAFRATVVGPKPVRQNLSSSALMSKKSFLQKGKVRENLTKKIYATSNGRRKRAWDRDCEIEFWKHRCFETPKPEKIETLKSVLALLRSSTEDPKTGKLLTSTDANPILSRLYLADTSIFPRTDDIKPVMALREADTQQLSKERRTSELSSPIAPALKVTDKGKNRLSSLKQPNTLQSSVSKTSSQSELVGQSDLKSDKKRWALEVLARKTAKLGQALISPEQMEKNASFNGNYPILAQLPVDMKPTPTFIRQNKIPMHVRQAQLYRLTEHLLKQADLPVIRRTAATELAIADAVNIEKGIAGRSTSKLVYVNLCSQEVLRHSSCNTTISKNVTSVEPQVPSDVFAVEHNINEAISDPLVEVALENVASLEPILPLDDFAEEQKSSEATSDPAVEEALKNTGLLPDSPPVSPRPVKDGKDDKPKTGSETSSHSAAGASNGFGVSDLESHNSVNSNVVTPNKIEELNVTSNLSPFTSVVTEEKDYVDLPSCPSFPIGKTEEHCLISATDLQRKESHVPKIADDNGPQETSTANHEESACPKVALAVGAPTSETAATDGVNISKDEVIDSAYFDKHSANHLAIDIPCQSSAKACSVESSKPDETSTKVEEQKSDICNSVSKKVEAFIKEHIRPLCKSGVITVEQYRWAVSKTTQKVMQYHSKDKNAHFLIKEGEKVKKLALQYLEGSQKTEKA